MSYGSLPALSTFPQTQTGAPSMAWLRKLFGRKRRPLESVPSPVIAFDKQRAIARQRRDTWKGEGEIVPMDDFARAFNATLGQVEEDVDRDE